MDTIRQDNTNCTSLNLPGLQNWTAIPFLNTENWTTIPFLNTKNWTKLDFQNEEQDAPDVTDAISRDINITRLVIFLSCIPMCVAGLGANFLNLAVFRRYGFRESVNVSFFCLTICDLVNVVVVVIFCLAAVDIEIGYNIAPPEIGFISSWVNYGLSLNGCCIAVFISIERCLCTALPLKVKDIITPRRSTFILAAIFVLTMSTVLPVLSLTNRMWVVAPCSGEQILDKNFPNRRSLIFLISNFSYTVLQEVSLVCLLIATVLLILFLKRHSKQRQRMTARGSDVAQNSDTTTSRDQRVVKMVVIVSSVLLVCYGPAQAITLASYLEPEFQSGGRYDYAFGVSWAVAFFLYAANSSVNLIIYYNMSSRFKNTLKDIMK